MLLPLGDENHGRTRTPYIVYSLITANIVVFILQLLFGDEFTVGYAIIPLEITTGVDLIAPARVPDVGVIPQAPGPTPIYLTLITSMFMHGGFLHIGFNMLYLWIFGDNIEDNFGHMRFLIFYLLCGLVAAFAQIAFDPTSVIPTLGASGAIAGVLGAYLVLFPHNRVRALVFLGFLATVVRIPAVLVLGFWIVTQFLSQLVVITHSTAQTGGGGVAYMAHIGGFMAGVVLVFLFRRRKPLAYHYR